MNTQHGIDSNSTSHTFNNAWFGLWRHWGYAPASFATAMKRCVAAGEVLAMSSASWRSELKLTTRQMNRLSNLRKDLPTAREALENWLSLEGEHELGCLKRGQWVLGPSLERDALVGAMRSPPPFLYVHGARDCIDAPMAQRVTVVGSRKVSEHALRQTRTIAQAVVNAGAVVVSGGAIGVDGAAHAGALAAGGLTMVVLAVGLDRLYPKSHRRLFSKVVESNGALLTPFPLGFGAKRYHFPRRNVMMAAMSAMTIVTRARARSGSLMTAQAAAAFGRPVFVVPGDIGLQETSGSNEVLAAGGRVLADPGLVPQFLKEAQQGLSQEIVQLKLPLEKKVLRNEQPHWTGLAGEIVSMLKTAPSHTDEIVRKSGCGLPKVNAVLLELELVQCVVRGAGGCYHLRERR